MPPNEPIVDFKTQVYTVLRTVPAGRVISYGQLARLAGKPNGARQVGAILKQLPATTTLPWHRVVNSQRRCSLPAGSKALATQQQRLEAEGVVFLQGRIARAHVMQ